MNESAQSVGLLSSGKHGRSWRRPAAPRQRLRQYSYPSGIGARQMLYRKARAKAGQNILVTMH